MITEETQVSTEVVAHLRNSIYSYIISDFIAYSNEEVKQKINGTKNKIRFIKDLV